MSKIVPYYWNHDNVNFLFYLKIQTFECYLMYIFIISVFKKEL